MEIRLYYNKSDKEHLNKDIELITTLPCVMKEGNNLVSPSITLEIDMSVLIKCNYAYLTELNRYYYIDDTMLLRQNYYQIDLTEDVLMTWKDYILKQEGIVGRQENNYDLTIQDERLMVRNNAYVQTKLFPNGFNMSKDDFTYVLIVGGNNVKIETAPAEGV